MTDLTGELRQFIERHETLEAERKAVADQQKEVMSEATSRGYDAKAIREVIRLRKMNPDDRATFEAIVGMYRTAAGV